MTLPADFMYEWSIILHHLIYVDGDTVAEIVAEEIGAGEESVIPLIFKCLTENLGIFVPISVISNKYRRD